jgi:hypothetical protein
MRVTFPEPPSGWRTFTWEVAIVFIGVVLALAGERLIQEYNWGRDARQASTAIKQELAEHRLAAIERLAVQPCMRRQIKALHEKLLAHRGGIWTGLPMRVNQGAATAAQQRTVTVAYRSPEPPWVDEAWQIARFTGALNHLPSTDVSGFARVYRLSNQYLEKQREENAAGARLSVLAVDGAIDNQSRVELLGALAQVDHANAYLELGAKMQIDLLRPLLSDLPAAEVDQAVAERIANQRAFRGDCVLPLKLSRS